MQEKLSGLDGEIASLKEKVEQMPVAAVAKTEGDATADFVAKEDFSKLETRTKGGFGKVKDDMKKLNEGLDKRLTELDIDSLRQEVNALKDSAASKPITESNGEEAKGTSADMS